MGTNGKLIFFGFNTNEKLYVIDKLTFKKMNEILL